MYKQNYRWITHKIPCVQEFIRIRDGAYALGLPTCVDLPEAYVLHLSISLECAEAVRSNVGFTSHMASIVLESADVDRTRAARLVIDFSNQIV